MFAAKIYILKIFLKLFFLKIIQKCVLGTLRNLAIETFIIYIKNIKIHFCIPKTCSNFKKYKILFHFII